MGGHLARAPRGIPISLRAQPQLVVTVPTDLCPGSTPGHGLLAITRVAPGLGLAVAEWSKAVLFTTCVADLDTLAGERAADGGLIAIPP